MPNPTRDAHSGALIFIPTEEELATRQLKAELEELKDELTTKIEQLNQLLSNNTQETE